MFPTAYAEARGRREYEGFSTGPGGLELSALEMVSRRRGAGPTEGAGGAWLQSINSSL